MHAGDRLTIDIEKPTAGGRMLGRHDGRVVLVQGAIPGERVVARVERVGRGVVYAETLDVLSPSADRRAPRDDWRCGGNVFAHIAYPAQLRAKGEIVRDAFAHIGRLPLSGAPAVAGSPETGYRLRARLHAHEGRLGFFREGTHQVCDAAATGQLAEETCAWLAAAEAIVQRGPLSGLASVEIAENVAGTERAAHLELRAGVDPAAFLPLAAGLVGLSAGRADAGGTATLSGVPAIVEVLHGRDGDRSAAFRLRRDVRAFFQGNRFLLEPLRSHVTAGIDAGPVVDLYAGVGLFGLSLAASGLELTLVEGDPVSGADLATNAEAFGGRARVVRESVEAYLGRRHRERPDHCIVDPPRTGMSKDAIAGLVRLRPGRIVYVSCDVATLARDARVLVDAGYTLAGIEAFDLFPNTAHVETVVDFRRDQNDVATNTVGPWNS